MDDSEDESDILGIQLLTDSKGISSTNVYFANEGKIKVIKSNTEIIVGPSKSECMSDLIKIFNYTNKSVIK